MAQAIPANITSNLSIGEVRKIYSNVLNEERTLNIYLPDGYANDDTTAFDVFYLLDGSMDEDIIHVAGLVQFSTFPWINWVKPSIVVGIANVDRRRDFTFPTSIAADKEAYPTTGSSAAFIEFIKSELQPFIAQHYKISDQRILIGQSLGGLLASEILITQPDLFTEYIIVSPSLWWDKESFLQKPFESFRQPKMKIAIGVGKEAKDMIRDAKRLSTLLKKYHGDKVMIDFKYFPEYDHATILHGALLHFFRR